MTGQHPHSLYVGMARRWRTATSENVAWTTIPIDHGTSQPRTSIENRSASRRGLRVTRRHDAPARRRDNLDLRNATQGSIKERVEAMRLRRFVQGLPQSTLQWLAASSVGLGAGFFLSGAPRIVIAAGMTPALLIGAAIVARQTDPGSVAEAGRRAGTR
jgi:hypothetical protein